MRELRESWWVCWLETYTYIPSFGSPCTSIPSDSRISPFLMIENGKKNISWRKGNSVLLRNGRREIECCFEVRFRRGQNLKNGKICVP